MNLVQVSLTTNNLEKLKTFYINVFEFLLFSSWEKPKDGLRAVKLIRKETILEITESQQIIPSDTPFSMQKQGWNMIGFNVDNINEVLSNVTKNGGNINQGITPGVTVKEIAFVVDPDGNGIELITPHFANPKILNLKIDQYDRNELWSTGRITPDIQVISNYFKGGLWEYEIDETTITEAIQKAGDICGCPIPDKVREREGEIGAFNYLFGLSEIYNEISDILKDLASSLLNDWGITRTRDILNEPAGEDSLRIPERIRNENVVRGPGYYHEFSIIRLLWIDKNEKFSAKKLGMNKVKELIKKANSLNDLQVNLIAAIAEIRNDKEPLNETITIIAKGIAHEGFFKENNLYIQVKETATLLKEKYSDTNWYQLLIVEINRVLSIPISKPS